MLTRPQGTLDVMVQRTGDQGEGNVLFVQNNFYYDAFFLKAIGASTLYPSLDLPHSHFLFQFSTGPVVADYALLQMEVSVIMYVASVIEW